MEFEDGPGYFEKYDPFFPGIRFLEGSFIFQKYLEWNSFTIEARVPRWVGANLQTTWPFEPVAFFSHSK